MQKENKSRFISRKLEKKSTKALSEETILLKQIQFFINLRK